MFLLFPHFFFLPLLVRRHNLAYAIPAHVTPAHHVLGHAHVRRTRLLGPQLTGGRVPQTGGTPKSFTPCFQLISRYKHMLASLILSAAVLLCFTASCADIRVRRTFWDSFHLFAAVEDTHRVRGWGEAGAQRVRDPNSAS